MRALSTLSEQYDFHKKPESTSLLQFKTCGIRDFSREKQQTNIYDENVLERIYTMGQWGYYMMGIIVFTGKRRCHLKKELGDLSK